MGKRISKETAAELGRQGGIQARENRRRGVESLLAFLREGGSDRVEELYQRMLNDEELTKGEREFLTHYKDLMEYHTPKLTRVTGGTKDESKIELTIKYDTGNSTP
jgi:hypothetical protein